ncbi:hypothetical protein F5X68DRAFT_272438 [Plectosphaerella plurivora]|uniref:Zn(2)-C6 fungal-type domain-containing protein n=1 Tax=Plectosphaerella plurivora TaxID=936078 RepID=A0A9P8VN73_9PEZI|nr:hypothetical protein F5X68DRAFT_272438 [Plectosphaerella plurivora]
MEKTPDVGLFSKLSCVNCRHRKVKCGRDLPKCQRCVAQGLKCEYRARRPRASKKAPAAAASVPSRLFPSFLDRKLIDMLPDLMDGPNVKIDASIVLIYYCLLWQGSFFRGPGTFSNADIAYTRQLFICCLRTIPVWYAEATGTIADFVAAIFMAQTARENMEDNLSWEMHKRACKYAHVLDLHNMDNAERELSSPYVLTDDDRVAMWDLIQVDVFQRLANNRSASFAADLTKWRINMPWLSTDVRDEAQALEGEDQAISTMFFLARSRITFALLGFFEALEAMDSAVSHPLRIAEPFCQEIFTTFAEWRVVLCHLLDSILPTYEMISFALGAYSVHLAFGQLASGVIEGADAVEPQDLFLLQRTLTCIERTAKESRDFMPLTHGMTSIVAEARAKVASRVAE